MKFGLFKGKEKEVINNDSNNEQSNDILDDFDSFVTRKTNSGKPIIKDENTTPAISSFENNYTEEIGLENSDYSYGNTSSNFTNNNLSSNFESSYGEEVSTNNSYISNTINESQTIQSFNPYLNTNIGTYNDVEEIVEIEPVNNFKQIENPNPVVNELNEIPNNMENSQDVNVALSNIYGNNTSFGNAKQKEETINESPVEQNYVQEKPSVPVYANPYQNSDVDPGYKRCSKCGQKIREDYKQCFVCGTVF